MQHYSSTQTLFNTQAICHASACDQAKSMAILAPLAYHTVEAWRLRHCSVTERQMQGLYLERPVVRLPPRGRESCFSSCSVSPRNSVAKGETLRHSPR